MQTKSKVMDGFYHDKQKVQASYNAKPMHFDYGNIANSHTNESHPAVMHSFIEKFNWAERLNYQRITNQNGLC